ncbi:beta-lactamase-like protein [Mycena floridula]|nr:beta-lactamase-like protein [Mycena floridula]
MSFLNIPPSSKTVNVRAIDVTNDSSIPAAFFVDPVPAGKEIITCVPIYAFVIENKSLNKRIMFDLGVRKDAENHPPSLAPMVKGESGFDLTVRRGDVFDRLVEGGVDPATVDAVIWSHTHLDHIGDMAKFPSSTELVVGPGSNLKTYPTDPEATLLESYFANRKVTTLAFDGLKIGELNAFDFFGDGSLYLLDTPGHCPGHLCALARTTPTTALLLGGDACHHGGQLRPSVHLHRNLPCPGHLVQQARKSVLPETLYFETKEELEKVQSLGDFDLTSRHSPFLSIPKGPSAYHERDEALKTLEKLALFDADPDVMVMLAHDGSLIGVIDLFPANLNDWKAKGWKDKVLWAFVDKDKDGYRFGEK